MYASTRPIGSFVQQEPREGEPASEKTEAWVFFDDHNVYVSARLWDSHPEKIVANEMRRDHRNLSQNDNFGVALDTFYDRRNAFFFYCTPVGGYHDGLITDEKTFNRDWNTVLDVKTGRFEQGWTVEMAIPFKSLRYGTSPVWGINFRRRVTWKNEVSHLTPIPASFGRRGIAKMSSSAALVGLEPPVRSRALEIKPYSIGGLRTDHEAEPAFSNDLDGDIGGDLKYGITRSLTLDLTLNTDFAQVEEDEAQVNLTRFGLFFPEKRDFFLEGRDLFAFGGFRRGYGRSSPTPTLFFSRRIGLSENADEDDVVVPIQIGARLTGKAGPFGIGALHIRTGGDVSGTVPTTDFSVLRVKRDILRRSTIGLIATRRYPSGGGAGSNEVFGADAAFSFFQNLNLSGYYAETRTPGLEGDNSSHKLNLDYSGDLYGLELERLAVGEDFNPEIGFVPREDIVRHLAEARISRRPGGWDAVRKLSLEGRLDHIANGAGRLETRSAELGFRVDFESSDELDLSYERQFEFLDEEFEILDDLVIPPGEYEFQQLRLRYRLGQQRPVSGHLWVGTGGFYGGTRTSANYSGRVDLGSRLSIEPRISVNWLDFDQGSYTTRLIGGRVSYSFSPRAFLGALVQYSSTSQSLSANVRFRWEYTPGSDLFVVYSDGRDTEGPGRPALANRSFVVKLTRLFRF